MVGEKQMNFKHNAQCGTSYFGAVADTINVDCQPHQGACCDQWQ